MNDKLPVILLAVLILAGVAFGVWILNRGPTSGPGGEPDPIAKENGQDDRSDKDADRREDTTPYTDPGDHGDGPTSTPGDDDPKPDNGDETQPVMVNVTVKGRVIDDANGHPLASAVVGARFSSAIHTGRAIPHAGGATPSDAPAYIQGSTTSREDGSFTLSLRIQSYRTDGDAAAFPAFVVQAGLQGYVPAVSDAILDEDMLEGVELRLHPGVILSGRVVDADTNKGITAALVKVGVGLDWGEDRDVGIPTPSGSTRQTLTDEEGRFEITVKPDRYWVSVEAYNYEHYSLGSVADAPLNLTRVSSHELPEIRLAPAASITGRVVDDKTGEPIAGASVTIRGSAGFHHWGGESSGEDGRFTRKPVDPGRYEIMVYMNGYVTNSKTTATVARRQTVDVGDIRLDAGITLQGRVVDPAGSPVEGAMVEARPDTGSVQVDFSVGMIRHQWCTTDADGRFELSGLEGGDWRLGAKADGFAEARITAKAPGGPYEIVLSEGGRIVGVVVDADGNPVHGASVVAIELTNEILQFFGQDFDPEMLIHQWGGRNGTDIRTDEMGRFEVPRLAAGKYLVVAEEVVAQDGRLYAYRNHVEVAAGTVDVGTLAFPATGSLAVTVTRNGIPEIDIELFLVRRPTAVEIMGSKAWVRASTDEYGTAYFPEIPEGAWYVIVVDAEREGFDVGLMARRRVSVEANRRTEFRIELVDAELVNLVGRVTINGRPMARELILIGKGALDGIFRPVELKEGDFEVNNLAPGRYQIFVEIGHRKLSLRDDIRLESPGRHEYVKDFRTFTVSGRVTVPASPELAGDASVHLAYADDDDDGIAVLTGARLTASDGEFTVENVPAGHYRLTAWVAGVGMASLELRVTGDMANADLTIHGSAGTLQVVMKELDGMPNTAMPFGFLSVLDSAGRQLPLGEQQTMVMLTQGFMSSLDILSEGTYVVEIRAPGFVPVRHENVRITAGETTSLDFKLVGALTLLVQFAGDPLSQEQVNLARVEVEDANGARRSQESSFFEKLLGQEAHERPTLAVRGLGPDARRVHVKIPGYAEISLDVTYEKSATVTREVALVHE